MKRKQKLEEIVKNNIETIKSLPIKIGITTSLGYYYLSTTESLSQDFTSQRAPLAGYSVYANLNIIKKIIESRFDKNPQELSKFNQFLYENKEILSILNGLIATIVTQRYINNSINLDWGVIEKDPSIMFALTAIATDILIETKTSLDISSPLQKNRTLLQRIQNFAFENPSTVAIPTALTTSFSLFNRFYNYYIPEESITPAMTSTYFGLFTGVFTYYLTTLAGSIAHSDNIYRIKRVLNEMQRNKENFCSIELYNNSHLILDTKQKAIEYSRIAKKYYQQGDIDIALALYRQALKTAKNKNKKKTNLDFLIFMTGYPNINLFCQTIKYKMQKHKTTLDDIDQITRYFIYGKPKKSLKLADLVFGKNMENADFLHYYATLLDITGSESSLVWGKFLETIDKTRLRKTNLEAKYHKILTFEDPILKESLILKSGNSRELNDEFNKTKWVYDMYNDNSRVTKPIILLNPGKGNSTFVMAHANGEPINSDKETIKKAIYALADFHNKAKNNNKPINLQKINYEQELYLSLERLENPINPISQGFADNHINLMKTLDPESIIHNDLHSGNILYVTDSDSCCIIDFESMVYGPVQIDISSLLDNNKLGITSNEKKLQYLRLYHEITNYNIPFNIFFEEQLIASIHKNIRMSGTTFNLMKMENKQEHKNAFFYYINNLKNLKNNLERIDNNRDFIIEANFLSYLIGYVEDQHLWNL